MNKQLIFNSKPYLINNKNYSSLQFTIFFQIPYDKKYIGYDNLLKMLVMNSSLEYNTEESYNKKYKENMIIRQSLNIAKFNNNLFYEFNLIVPDPNKVKNYNLEEAFKFFIDTIYKPNIINNEFNNYYFEREKRFIKDNILQNKKNINYYADERYINHVDDLGIIKENLANNLEKLDTITPKDLYKYYKTNIINNTPILIAYGNIDDSINDLFYKYLKIKKKNIIINKDYYNFLKPSNNTKFIEEQSKYYQSILYTGYKIKNMSEEDILYLTLLEDIIGSNKLLFKKLRIKENLVYSVSAAANKNIGLYTVVTHIDNNSKDKAIQAINDVFNDLYNKKDLKKYLNKLISNLECIQIRSLDRRTKSLDDFINNKFEFDLTIEKIIDEYKNIDINKFYNFLDRVTLDTVYFLRGEFDGK